MAVKRIFYDSRVYGGKLLDAVVFDPYDGSKYVIKNFVNGTSLGTKLRFWFIQR